MGATDRILAMLFAILFIERLEFGCSSNATHSNVSSCIESEREALVKFRESLVDNANCLSSWVGKDCCAWKGVGCSKRTGHIVKLDVSYLHPYLLYDFDYIASFCNESLGGEINPSLLDLEHLHYLDLSANNFSNKQIPDFLGFFKSLRYLDLSFLNFGGKIPHHLGNLSRLHHLMLSGNALVGPIPDTLGRLNSLTVLDLSRNNFNTTMPQLLCNLSSLVHMDLSFNRFNHSIPRCLGNLTSLSVLQLEYNSFQGPIPSEMGNMTQLTWLHLSKNGFEGEIPKSIGNLCSLRTLDLSENNFSAGLSTLVGSPFGCIHNSLEDLDLYSNKFSGYLPNQLGEFKNLEFLSISENSFYGPLPSSLGRLSYLRVLGTSYNQLNGSIPSSLGQLSNLDMLDLSYNSFSGVVSEGHFAKLKSLISLYLSSNSFVLNMSSQWVPPFQLQTIEMISLKLGPQFPPWLQTQRRVHRLNMTNASISDTIPDWFENITYLDLSYNRIRGKLPIQECNDSNAPLRELILSSNKFEGPLTHLPSDVSLVDLSNNFLSGPIPVTNDNVTLSFMSLVLSNNHLTGGIPKSLCKAKFICIIDLSKNQLSGRIPGCLGHLPQLRVLDLSNNSLYGHIPSSLGSLRYLLSFHLRNNKFHGKIPLSLQNLTSLVTIDLGENAFTGSIPPWIGDKLSSLKFLSLQSNKFYGDIPPQVCHLSALQLLNLAQNNITGNIPHCFGNFTSMVALGPGNKYYVELPLFHYEDNIVHLMKGRELEYTKTLKFLISIDLSNNDIVGEIPEELMDLCGLRNLNLAGNHLKGRIPEKIGNLKQLESLDLSGNKLSGPIPPSLSILSYLSHLNLSFNNLSGRIPRGNQLQTLDNQSIYIGNDELCGALLLKSCPGDKLFDGNHEPGGGSTGGDESESLWFYAGIGPGFLVGFLGVCGTLHFKKSWRYPYFQFLENVFNRILVAIAVKAACLRRKVCRGKFGG